MATSCFSTEHLDDKGNKAVTVTFNKVVSKASGGKREENTENRDACHLE